MSETSRRVALLARPGAAREAVRGALLEIGADVVAEDDPTSVTPDAVRDATPDVLMIVLDAISEGTLDRFDALLGDPSIEVMFEEADVAAARDGWEAARWRRHLAAKLGHRDDVLPPVVGAEPPHATVDALSLEIEALMTPEPAPPSVSVSDAAPSGAATTMHAGIDELVSTDEPDFMDASAADVPLDIAGGDDFRVFDPATEAAATSDGAVEDYVLSVHGLELEPSATDAPLASHEGFSGLELEPSALDAALPALRSFDLEGASDEPLPPVTGQDFNASDFDPLLAELDAELPDLALPEIPALARPDWQSDLADPFAHGRPESETAAAPPIASPGTDVGARASAPSFGELSLADDVAPVAAAATGGARKLDLDDLERRIASLGLVDDAPAAPAASEPAPAAMPPALPPEIPTVDGVVLVLAGIGGPDAVRQLLGALPARFTRPVLIRQRLDGARYDRLVAQLQRASALPVALAQAGEMLRPGHVFVLPDDVALTPDAGAFVPGDTEGLVAGLPAAQSAVVVLSGADVALVDAIDMLRAQGAFVGAQAPEGCYDAAASGLLAARGAVEAPPAALATELVGRWGR